jgi:23S rRNA (guanosine2251-2'-O)-methyltransferase
MHGRQMRAGGDDRGEWLYGRRPVAESLRAGRRHCYELLLVEGGRRQAPPEGDLAEIRDRALRAGAAFRTVPRQELEDLLEGANHQGVALRVGAFPYCGYDQILHAVKADPQAIILFLDHIEDPQNVGSLLRTADAAGVTGVVLPEDRAAGVTAAAVRASAGAAEHLRVARVVNLVRAIGELKECDCWLTGLDMEGETRPYTEIDFAGRCGVVVGGEGRGLGRLVREHCDFVASLPLRGRVDSLNAGVAGALLLYEILRQRNVSGATGARSAPDN